MKKLIVRITIIVTTLYFALCFYVAQFCGIDIFSDLYVLLFELCVCIYCQSEPKYHCKYIKRLCWLIFMIDVLSRIDNKINFLSVSAHNLIPISLIALLTLAEFVQSIRHYSKVYKLKNRKNGKSD